MTNAMRTVPLRRSRRSQIVASASTRAATTNSDASSTRSEIGMGALAVANRRNRVPPATRARSDYRMAGACPIAICDGGVAELHLDPRTNRRRDPRRQPDRARHDARVLRPGRELPAGARRALRRPRHAAAHRLPAGRRDRLHGRSARQAHGSARHRLRHARTRRVERRDRHPHGGAGFDAADRLRRPGRRRLRRSRSVPGDRLSPDVRQRGQVGRADRSGRAHSRVCRARLSHGDVGPAGTGRPRVARGRAVGARGMRGRAPRGSGRRLAFGRGHRGGALGARRGRAAAGAGGRQPLGCARPAPRCGASPKPTSSRSSAPSAIRICSTTAIPTMQATSASA